MLLCLLYNCVVLCFVQSDRKWNYQPYWQVQSLKAVDTIDLEHLIHRLSLRYGITGTALNWFSSYLNNRTQHVLINNVKSDRHHLWCGVPQGSVAGPLEFILFSAPLQDLIAAHGISSVAYADDTQLYITFDPADRASAIAKVEVCIQDVKSWALSNKLALNDSKTEILFLRSRFAKKISPPTIQIAQSVIEPSEFARNLGVIMDSSLCMSRHCDNVCKGALMAIRKISQIRRYLDEATTLRLVHAFVTTRLDSCNSLLYGLPDKDLAKIQRVQNTAARLVSCLPRSHHITPVLMQLHWLPVKFRTVYKILLLTFKAQTCQSPAYLSELVHHYSPTRTLRSSQQSLLSATRASSIFYGHRSFSYAAPFLWNSLPVHIRQANTLQCFKSLLKTHLFKASFL